MDIVALVVGATGIAGRGVSQELLRCRRPRPWPFAPRGRRRPGRRACRSRPLRSRERERRGQRAEADPRLPHRLVAPADRGREHPGQRRDRPHRARCGRAGAERQACRAGHRPEALPWAVRGLCAQRTPAADAGARGAAAARRSRTSTTIRRTRCTPRPRRDGFTWSVHRPHTIIGKAIGNAMNMGSTLAAYASICKELGRPFKFPGSAAQWNGLTDMTDARVLGKQLVWASTTDVAKNEAYNIVNGDIFRWSWLWPRIAEWFGVAWEGFAGAPVPLEAQMANDAEVWTADGGEIRPRRARPLARRLALAHRPRPRSADRGDDGHGPEPQARLPRLPEHRGGLPRPVRRPCARRRSFPDPSRRRGVSGGRRLRMRDGSRWKAAAESRAGQAALPRLTEGEGREDREDPRQAGRTAIG